MNHLHPLTSQVISDDYVKQPKLQRPSTGTMSAKSSVYTLGIDTTLCKNVEQIAASEKRSGSNERSVTLSDSQPTSQTPRNTLNAGIDTIYTRKNDSAEKRVKRGECPTCGQQLVRKYFFCKDEPITEVGLVFRGQCLKCNPIEGYIRRRPNDSRAAMYNLEINGMAKLPQLTLTTKREKVKNEKHRNCGVRKQEKGQGNVLPLIQREQDMYHRFHQESVQQESISGIAIPKQIKLTVNSACQRQSEISAISMDSVLLVGVRSDIDRKREIKHQLKEDDAPLLPKRRPTAASDGESQDRLGPPRRSAPSYRDYSQRARSGSTTLPLTTVDSSSSKPDNINHPPKLLEKQKEKLRYPQATRAEIASNEARNSLDQRWKAPPIAEATMGRVQVLTHTKHVSLSSPAPKGERSQQPCAIDEHQEKEKHGATGSAKRAQVSIEQLPNILYSLNMEKIIPFVKENALRSLAQIMWKHGEKARCFLERYEGVTSLIKTVWVDMDDAQIVDAGAEFLLSVVASTGADPQRDLLLNKHAVCDSLLIAMQVHSKAENIQLKGCAILACLAASSSVNADINDGTLSGAVMMVSTAMYNHKNCLDIQKAGLQALHHQCTFSKNAEMNRRSLIDIKHDNGQNGLGVVLDVFDTALRDDRTAMSWLCHILWDLTSNDSALINASEAARRIMRTVAIICHENIARQDSGDLLSSGFGVIANLAHVDSHRMALFELGIVSIILLSMECHPGEISVNQAACSALGNLATFPGVSCFILQHDGVGMLLNVLSRHIENETLVAEVLRVLLSIAINLNKSKADITSRKNFRIIAKAISEHQDSNEVQDCCCRLLASLSTERALADSLLRQGCLGITMNALKSQRRFSMHDAACAALRNLSCQVQESDELIRMGALKSIVQSMTMNQSLLSLQTSGCVAIWNIVSKATFLEPARFLPKGRVVETIVATMQNHMESSGLLEAACGALWCIVDSDIEMQEIALAAGGVDTVVCTCIMHPTEASTLTNACGVLSNLSAAASVAEEIANAQGVSVIADAVHYNASAHSFLEVACLTLRNLVTTNPTYADEASLVIPIILEAMRYHIASTRFQIEACKLIWVLAAESRSCRSKVLSLNGVAALTFILESNRNNPGLEAPARRALSSVRS